MSTPSLGAPLRAFPYDPDQRKATLLIGLGMLGLSLVFPALYFLDPVATGIAPLFLSPLVAIIGALAIAHFFYTRGIALTLYPGGFTYRDETVPYERVRGVRYKLVHVVGGSSSYNRGFFRIRLDDGTEVSTTMQLEKMEEAIGGVVQQTMPIVVEGTIGALRAGHVVRVGPFELHPQGLVCKGKSIPWARVALSSSGSNTHVQLLDVDPESGDYTKVHEAKIADIDNADALEVIGERLRAEAIRNRY